MDRPFGRPPGFPVRAVIAHSTLVIGSRERRCEMRVVERAALRWHGRLETESRTLTLAESQLALAALASLCAGERGALKDPL